MTAETPGRGRAPGAPEAKVLRNGNAGCYSCATNSKTPERDVTPTQEIGGE